MVNIALITFIVYLLIILSVTYYISKRMRGVDVEDYESEFFVGGRDMGVLVIAIIVAAGGVSTGTFVGAPALAWEYGVAFGVFAFAQFTLNLHLLGVYGKKISIISRRIDANSLLDIFITRYDEYTPFILSFVFTIVIFLEAYLAAEFAGGARVIAAVTDLPYLVSLFAFGGIVVLYTSLGGLRGTGIVGIIQGIFMSVGVLLLFGGILSNTDNIFQSVEMVNSDLLRPPGKDISWFYFISTFISIFLGGLGLPHAIQGALGFDSTKVLKRSASLGVLVVTVWTAVLILAGIAGKALIPSNIAPDLIIPLLTLKTLPGVPAGIVLAGVIGAAQTTVGVISILIGSSLVINIYDEYIQPNASSERRQLVTTSVTAAVGITGILLAATEPPLLELIVIFAIGGIVSGLVPPMLLGLYWPRANRYGAFAASFIGTVSYIVLTLWAPPPISRNPIVITLSLSFISIIVVSLITDNPSEDIIRVYFGHEK